MNKRVGKKEKAFYEDLAAILKREEWTLARLQQIKEEKITFLQENKEIIKNCPILSGLFPQNIYEEEEEAGTVSLSILNEN